MTSDKARKAAIRARMDQTGEPYSVAARNLDASPAAAAAVPVAERDWSTRARVRITAAYSAGAPYSDGRDFAVGEELEMVQWGRAGRQVERDAWWTSTNIDGAFIVPAEHVEVLDVVRDNPPTWAAAAMPAERVVELFGPDAAGWAERGVVVIDHWRHYQVRAVDGELLGLVDRDHRTGELAVPERWVGQPVQYRAVIFDNGLSERSVPMPGGFVPPSPARAADGERIRWSKVPGVVAPATMRP